MMEVSAFRWVPPFAQGYVKDIRVRWALEEAGLPYRVTLIDPRIQRSADYRAWQPFGQVPALRDGAVELFETGAIVLHIAARSDALMPHDEAKRARVVSWVFAALNSVEPFAINVIQFDTTGDDADGLHRRRAAVEERLHQRLRAVTDWLANRVFLEDDFTVADIIMATVLRELADSGNLSDFDALNGYLTRCLARPGFAVALDAQMQTFRDNAPDLVSGQSPAS